MEATERIIKLTMDSTIGEVRAKLKTKAFLDHCSTLRAQNGTTVSAPPLPGGGRGKAEKRSPSQITVSWKQEVPFAVSFLNGGTEDFITNLSNKDDKPFGLPLNSWTGSFFTRIGAEDRSSQEPTYKKDHDDFKKHVEEVYKAAREAYHKSDEELTVRELSDTLLTPTRAKTAKGSEAQTALFRYSALIRKEENGRAFLYVLEQIMCPTPKEQAVDLISNGDARQIVFTGAPGSGKTYIAKEIAQYFKAQGLAADISLTSETEQKPQPYVQVQFHPSYDYTDFVEGLRPIELPAPAENGKSAPGVNFAKVDGIFKQFCREVVRKNRQWHSDTTRAAQAAGEVRQLVKDPDTALSPDSRQALEAVLNQLAEGRTKTAALALAAAIDDIRDLRRLADLRGEEGPDRTLDAGTAEELLRVVRGLAARGSCAAQERLKELESALSAFLFVKTRLIPAIGRQADSELPAAGLDELVFTDPECTIRLLLERLKEQKDRESAAAQAHLLMAVLLQADEARLSDEALKALKRSVRADSSASDVLSKIGDLPPDDEHAPLEARLQNECFELLRSPALTPPEDARTLLKPKAEALAEALETDPASFTPRLPLYFFIIDEINRANLPKVFGELMYSMEKDKRGSEHGVHTQYQNLPTYCGNGTKQEDTEEKDVFTSGFYIPENVVIIGTMNDIDRSVDSMDFALRRRFEWIEFKVDQNTLTQAFEYEPSYGAFIKKHAPSLAKQLHGLNQFLEQEGAAFDLNRQYFIGQGHFSNLPRKFREATAGPNSKAAEKLLPILEYVWEYRIESLLREYLRGRSESDVNTFLRKARAKLTEFPKPQQGKQQDQD